MATAMYPGVEAHSGVSLYTHSLERFPYAYDTDNCAVDFRDSAFSESRGVAMTETRTNAEKEKQRASLISVAAVLFLIALKVGVGLLTGSLGILAQAADSVLGPGRLSAGLFCRARRRPARRRRASLRAWQSGEPGGAGRNHVAAGDMRLDRLRGHPAPVFPAGGHRVQRLGHRRR